MTENLFTQDDLIYAYTRAQALEDGEQVQLTGDLAKLATEVGFKWPVYVTSAVWETAERAIANERHLNDRLGVWWDILWMASLAARRCKLGGNSDVTAFRVIIKGAGRKSVYNLLIQAGPTDIDDDAPCLCIMFPEEV